MKKKILVIGNSLSARALCNVLAEENNVYLTSPGNSYINSVKNIDIRENNSKELLEFVLENDIDLTIITSLNTVGTDIVNLFNNNKQLIFGPDKKSYETIFNKSLAKKIMYKLRIPTPKFGIFDKESASLDYIKNHDEPLVLKTNEPSSAVIVNANIAKNIINSLFAEKAQKVILEDYIPGTSFSFYVVTDGYKALPIGSSIIYKHSLEGDGGQLTSGMGAISPNYKLSISNEYYIMDEVVYPVIEYLASNNSPYVGILGVEGILTNEGRVFITGFHNFFQDCDAVNILNLIQEDLPKLFESCVIGSFSDEINNIKISNNSAVSLALCCRARNKNANVITGLDNLSDDIICTFYPNTRINRYMEWEADYGQVMMITAFGSTTASASKKVWAEVNNIDFNGMYYRKDIGNRSINPNF